MVQLVVLIAFCSILEERKILQHIALPGLQIVHSGFGQFGCLMDDIRLPDILIMIQSYFYASWTQKGGFSKALCGCPRLLLSPSFFGGAFFTHIPLAKGVPLNAFFMCHFQIFCYLIQAFVLLSPDVYLPPLFWYICQQNSNFVCTSLWEAPDDHGSGVGNTRSLCCTCFKQSLTGIV